MKKLLYITANSKPESLSTSKTVGRAFVNRFVEKNPEFILEEIDLYKEYRPHLTYKYFEGRNCLVKEIPSEVFSKEEENDIKVINKLCDKFLEGDMYVIAAPMWSILFPAPLKEYLDCVILSGKTIKVSKDEIKGLLDDKERKMVYIQSSGGKIPWLLNRKMNHGGCYLRDIFKFLGVSKFDELNVDGTGFTEEERVEATKKALDEIDDIIDKL